MNFLRLLCFKKKLNSQFLNFMLIGLKFIFIIKEDPIGGGSMVKAPCQKVGGLCSGQKN